MCVCVVAVKVKVKIEGAARTHKRDQITGLQGKVPSNGRWRGRSSKSMMCVESGCVWSATASTQSMSIAY